MNGRASSTPPPRARAFSLLELAVALALITAAAAIAIPLFYGRPEVTLDNAAILLAHDLRAAQNHAVHQRAAVRVEFFEDGSGYRALLADEEPMPNPSGAGPLARRYSADGVFEGVHVERVRLGEGRTARFTPDGSAELGGEITLGYRDQLRRVTLQEGSGLVAIEGLERPWSDSGF